MGKKIGASDMRGDKGIALIHRIVNDMGFVWNALHLEAGIDGLIEVRDSVSAEVSNCIIQVQSKAGPSYFKAETATSFEFICDERDLEYWLRGNAPVVLVVSRPDDNEAYWVSLKDYFRDPLKRKSRKIVFDKATNAFNQESREALAKLAMPVGQGLFLPALPVNETLASNLLPLVDFPKRLYRASTSLRFGSQVWEILNQRNESSPAEWSLHNGKIYTFHDIAFPPWDSLCDQSTAENLSTEKWSKSNNSSEKHLFSKLIRSCISQLLWRHGVRLSKDKQKFYFKPTLDLKERKVGGLSVFKGFGSKTTPGRVAYYRHRAMDYRLVRFDDAWFVEITPTYHFTQDGYRLSRFYEERLKGIKLIERQNKVHLRQIKLWESVFRQTYEEPELPEASLQQSLFKEEEITAEKVEPYSLIAFGELLKFDVDWGIPESVWLPPGQAEESDIDSLQGTLFDT